MNIFLDDERIPSDVFWLTLPSIEWVIIRTPEEFIKCITDNPLMITNISFDNDIQHELEGYHLIKIICDMDMDSNYNLLNKDMKVYAHTMNSVNRQPIINYWINYQQHRQSL